MRREKPIALHLSVKAQPTSSGSVAMAASVAFFGGQQQQQQLLTHVGVFHIRKLIGYGIQLSFKIDSRIVP